MEDRKIQLDLTNKDNLIAEACRLWHKHHDKPPGVIAVMAGVTEEELRKLLKGVVRRPEWSDRENFCGYEHDKGAVTDAPRCPNCGIVGTTCPYCDKEEDSNAPNIDWEDLMTACGWRPLLVPGMWVHKTGTLFDGTTDVPCDGGGVISREQYYKMAGETPAIITEAK